LKCTKNQQPIIGLWFFAREEHHETGNFRCRRQ
jgi:hypothetical protein